MRKLKIELGKLFLMGQTAFCLTYFTDDKEYSGIIKAHQDDCFPYIEIDLDNIEGVLDDKSNMG